MDPNDTVIQIIEAHGGVSLWKSLDALEANISVWGFLFTTKRRPVLKNVRVSASAKEARFAFHDFPSPGLTSELIGDQEVRIIEGDGKVIARRVNPRAAFKGLRRMLYWDRLDFIYFGGYATWNYLVTPFLFLRDGFYFEVLEPMAISSSSWLRLRVTFPNDIPTHCKTQVLYFNENLYLQRIDYTAEVVGRWAHAAHLCENYQDFGGLKAPTRRRVRPVFIGNKPLAGLTLVAIDVHNIRPVWSKIGTE
jgi:hypothetical protein